MNCYGVAMDYCSCGQSATMLCGRCKSPTCSTASPQHVIELRGVRAGSFTCDVKAMHSAGRGICPSCTEPAAREDLGNSRLDEILIGHDDFEKACYAIDMNNGRANWAGGRFGRPQLPERSLLTVWDFNNFAGPYLNGVPAEEFGRRVANSVKRVDVGRFNQIKTGTFSKMEGIDISTRGLADDRPQSSGFVVASAGTLYRKVGAKKNGAIELAPVPESSLISIPSGVSMLFGNY